jgi:molybdopterin molybdotransferase
LQPAPCPLPLDAAISWIEAAVAPLSAEPIPVSAGTSRTLAEDILAERPIPSVDCAALDGFAVKADATLGAGSYNPLLLPLHIVTAGEPMPAGTDAVIPLGLGQVQLDTVECVETVAPGDNVDLQGSVAAVGTALAPAGTPLSPRHLGLLMGAGVSTVAAICRPRVRIVVVAPATTPDGNGPMIGALVERDGGALDTILVERSRAGIKGALAEDGADMVLVIGGTGPGVHDHAAAALADAGELAIHGISLRPGETTGLGRTSIGIPVILLPGTPAASLFGYELIAGRAIRRLGGRDQALPYRSRSMITDRKLVSSIGMTEICPVRCAGEKAVEPLPSFAEIGMMAAATADGFVIVPKASEGYPPGARVTVYLYDGR